MATPAQSIYILYTGGTIGCVGSPLSPMSAADFKAAFDKLVTPTITSAYPGTTVLVDATDTPLDSTNMQPSEWTIMADKIISNYSEYTNFLILHGTDTMAWTASALSYMLPGVNKSVTVTGSQLPLFYKPSESGDLQILFNTDALRNVLGAISFFEFNVPEVTLYFSDCLLRGNRSVKSDSSDFVAFSSPNYPRLGRFGVEPELESQFVLRVPSHEKSMSNPIWFHKVRKTLDTIKTGIDNNPVIQFQIFPGYYSATGEDSSDSLMSHMLRALNNPRKGPKISGYILQSYGIGNIPSYPSMTTEVKRIVDDGAIAVDCTQVAAGGTDFNEYATGSWLGDAGVISANDMTPLSSMAKLTILYAQYGDAKIDAAAKEAIETAMGTDLAGELTNYYALSSFQNEYLAPGECISSISGKYQLSNEKSGGLALYDLENGTQLNFASSEPGRLISEKAALVLYDELRKPVKTFVCSDSSVYTYVRLDDDGKLAFYNLDTDKKIEDIDISDWVNPDAGKNRPGRKRKGTVHNKTKSRKGNR